MQNLRTWTSTPPWPALPASCSKLQRVAMVVGQTVHLSGTTREEFLADPEWVAHESVHLRQYQEHGLLPFLWKYLVESARVGYYHNKYRGGSPRRSPPRGARRPQPRAAPAAPPRPARPSRRGSRRGQKRLKEAGRGSLLNVTQSAAKHPACHH